MRPKPAGVTSPGVSPPADAAIVIVPGVHRALGPLVAMAGAL
jgi:hypothetical protein